MLRLGQNENVIFQNWGVLMDSNHVDSQTSRTSCPENQLLSHCGMVQLTHTCEHPQHNSGPFSVARGAQNSRLFQDSVSVLHLWR